METPAPGRGASSLWFLPPPLTFLHRKLGGIGVCSLAACTKDDLINQRVGIGQDDDESPSSRSTDKRNVYNCQPLNYEDMTVKQQLLFHGLLDVSGTTAEYPEETRQAH